jgi:hypothetical protein
MRLERVELDELRLLRVGDVVRVARRLLALVGQGVDLLGRQVAALFQDLQARVGDAGRNETRGRTESAAPRRFPIIPA